MRDAVAEILVEREQLPHGMVLGIIASVALHAIIAGAFFVGVRSVPVESARVLNIRLAPASPAAQPVRTSAATPKPAAAEAKPATAPIEKPAAKPVEPAKTAEAKPKQKPVEKSLFGQSKKSGGDAPPARSEPTSAPAATASTEASGFAMPAVGTAGVSALEGGDFPYSIYIDRMVTLIGSRWFRPQVAGDAITQIYFLIDRDGRVRDAKIEKSSGNTTFDRAALRAVIEASPLPPLPFGYSGNNLGVHLIFH